MTQPESRTVEERQIVLEAIRTALTVHDAARDLELEQSLPGLFESPERGFLAALEGQDPPLTVILAAAQEHGLVIGEGELDAAWKEAEAALPEEYVLTLRRVTDDRWNAIADGPAEGVLGQRHQWQTYESTPTAALHALAERLRR